MKEITNLCTLNCIEQIEAETNQEGIYVSSRWKIEFKFSGFSGFRAFLSRTEILKKHPSFDIVESDIGALHDSFMEAIEENWEKIVSYVREWEKEDYAFQKKGNARIEKNRIDAGLI